MNRMPPKGVALEKQTEARNTKIAEIALSAGVERSINRNQKETSYSREKVVRIVFPINS